MPPVLGLDDCSQVTVRITFYQDKFRIAKVTDHLEKMMLVFIEFEVLVEKQLIMLICLIGSINLNLIRVQL